MVAGFLNLVALTVLVTTAAAIEDFESYVRAFNKTYKNPLEATLRKQIFLRNKQFIEKFNAEQAGNGSFKLGLNHLSDLSDEEIRIRQGFRAGNEPRENSAEVRQHFARLLANFSLQAPDELDWTQVSGRVGPVRDQGQCGCDWAFAAVGGLEGQMLAHSKSHKLFPLSVQNLIDCSVHNAGCFGGSVDAAYDDITFEVGGIEAESTYPYTGEYYLCNFNKSRAVFNAIDYHIFDQKNEEMLKIGVAMMGPVTAEIDGTQDSFRHYQGGVYYEPKCRHKHYQVTNSVLIVGYGTDKATGMDYWLLKNSWGTGWGEKGFMRLARNRNNHCGITELATVPIF